PRRIGLRPRDARHGRERGSAGGQMQKISAGEFHFNLPSHHSITSSARAGRLGGTSMPGARAGGRLMTRSNFLHLIAGKSAGLGPLQDAARIDADLPIRIPNVGSIAHQPAGFRKLTHVIDCRKGMSCRQYSKLEAPADKERIRANQQRIGFVVNKRPESIEKKTEKQRNPKKSDFGFFLFLKSFFLKSGPVQTPCPAWGRGRHGSRGLSTHGPQGEGGGFQKWE